MDLLSRVSPLVEKKRKYSEINNEALTTLTLCSGYPITKIHKKPPPPCQNGTTTPFFHNDQYNSVFSSTTRNLLDKTRFFNSEIMKQNQQQQQQEEKSGISTELTLFSSGHQKLMYKKPGQNKNNRPTLVDEVSGRDDTSVSTLLSLSWNINSKPEVPRRNLEDPWKIRKQLTGSDLGQMSRLLFPSDLVNKYIKPLLKKEQFEMVEKDGFKVRVWDCDTRSEHNLVFKRWYSSKGFVFLNGWIPEFVKRRNLKENDDVGVYWDVSKSRFNFSVLRRAS